MSSNTFSTFNNTIILACPYGEYYQNSCQPCNYNNTHPGYTTYTIGAIGEKACFYPETGLSIDVRTFTFLQIAISGFYILALLLSSCRCSSYRYKIIQGIRSLLSGNIIGTLSTIIILLKFYPYSLNKDYQKTEDFNQPIYIAFISATILYGITLLAWTICFFAGEFPAQSKKIFHYLNFFNLCSDGLVMLVTLYFFISVYTKDIPIKNNGVIVHYDTLRPEFDYTISYLYLMIISLVSLVLNLGHGCCLKEEHEFYEDLDEVFLN